MSCSNIRIMKERHSTIGKQAVLLCDAAVIAYGSSNQRNPKRKDSNTNLFCMAKFIKTCQENSCNKNDWSYIVVYLEYA